MEHDILSIQPGELKFPFELGKQISCSLQLVNTIDNYVAFKVKTTSPKKYCVRPNASIIPPGAICDVTVTMQAQRDAPPDMQCKDKFLVQSVVVEDGAQLKEVSQDLFNKTAGNEVSESKLRVVYVPPPQPPSPVPESAEEGVSPIPSMNLDNGFHAEDDILGDLKAKLVEEHSNMTRLTDEKNAALQRVQQLQKDLATKTAVNLGKSGIAVRERPSGFSFFFVLLIGLLGILVGYFLRS